ncbi:MAG TPA: DUF6569 family protein [Vicinamibacterales bacterium]|nr:DUF6569 family protein [Vicinamibacterales bacterium]
MKLHTLSHALRVGPPVDVANLTMYPLIAAQESPAGYATLDEALAAGFVKVTEVSEAGHVPELSVVNNGPIPVLILDGEELIGAKQNRIVNLTILVPARTKLPLPVTCVEAGRWAHRSRSFSAAGRAHYASGRAMKLTQVSHYMRTAGVRHADQGAIWHDIDAKAERMAAFSPTHAAAAMYEQAREALDAFQAKLEAASGQLGAVFAINGAIVGLEAFDSPATWRKSMRKIVESYGLDALDRRDERRARARRDPARFLAAVSRTSVERFPAVGLGEDLRLQAPKVAGAALALDDELVHLLAYAS